VPVTPDLLPASEEQPFIAQNPVVVPLALR